MAALAAFCGIVLAAALVQGISGFAFNMIVLMVFPHLFGYTSSLALGGLLAVVANFYSVALYRKHINWTWVFRWLAVYLVADLLAVFVLKKVGDHPIWYTLMGVIFVLMAIYLLWGQKLIRVQASVTTLLVTAILSGLIMGMFGVGGPLLAAFFLVATHGNKEYLGTSQLAGGCAMGIDFLIRMGNGMFPMALAGYALLGFVVMIAGALLAKRLVSHMDPLVLRKFICLVIFCDGIFMLFHNV